MINKKRIEIARFDNFKDKSNVITQRVYNFFATDKLKNSKGIELAKFPYSAIHPEEYSLNLDSFSATSINGVAFFKQFFNNTSVTNYKLLLYDNAGNEYMNYLLDDDPTIATCYNLTFHTPPITLAFKQNGVDALILADDQKMVIWKTMSTPTQLQNVPIITSMCNNGDVLFCTLLNPAFKIWYTTDLNAENVGDIGKNSNYISLEDDLGDAKKVITFDRNVYVIREFGISKIKFIKNEIEVSEVFKSNTRILFNTISICGNEMWFMTKDGLFKFNGIKVKKSNVDVDDLLSGLNDKAIAASIGNEYFVALNLNFDDSKQVLCETNQNHINNALIIVNSLDETYQIIRGVDIKYLLPVKTPVFEKMLCIFNSDNASKLGQICGSSKCFSSNLPKYWLSEKVLKNDDPKLLTKLVVDADIGVVFKIIYGNKVQSFTTYKSGLNIFNFKIYCNNFKLEISSTNESAKVNKVYIDYHEE